MAGGWSRDGAVNEQIEASIKDELERLKFSQSQGGESLSHCEDCGDVIPKARRDAIPGVRLCVKCQQEQDSHAVHHQSINRRGSKDSQLR